MVSTLVIALPAPVPVAPATVSVHSGGTYRNASPPNGYGPASKRTLVAISWQSGTRLESWGYRGTLITTKQGYHTGYSINFSVSLPLARILGSYALIGCLSLRSTPLCRRSFTFRHPSYFAVARVVDNQHPFMLACFNGDVETVRLMLRSGEGRPTDVTAEGETPMLVSQ